MKIATFNVNSIRVRQDIVVEWLLEHEPDVLGLQETKVEDSAFPAGPFEDIGYHVSAHGQKLRNGVALLTRQPPQRVFKGFDDPLFAEDCRLIGAEVAGVTVINTYAPNGTAVGSDAFRYKLAWFDRLRRLVSERFKPTDLVAWVGDINIAPTSADVYNPTRFLGHIGHHPDEFKALDAACAWGWEDCFRKFTSGPGHYTFWDYVILTSVPKNFGWRIDHIYASPALAKLCTECRIDKNPRLEPRPSDHTPVWAAFEL